MHLGMCWLWPGSGHWAAITLHQHRPGTVAILEALDTHLLRESQSHPPHRDPGSPESWLEWRWEV